MWAFTNNYKRNTFMIQKINNGASSNFIVDTLSCVYSCCWLIIRLWKLPKKMYFGNFNFIRKIIISFYLGFWGLVQIRLLIVRHLNLMCVNTWPIIQYENGADLWYMFWSQVLKVYPYPVTVTAIQFAVGTVVVSLMWGLNLYKKPKVSGSQVFDVVWKF